MCQSQVALESLYNEPAKTISTWTKNVIENGVDDDKLTRQLVEKITVFEGKLQVDFKSGVEIEVEI